MQRFSFTKARVVVALAVLVGAGVVGHAPAAWAVAPRCTVEGFRRYLPIEDPDLELVTFPAYYDNWVYDSSGNPLGIGYWSCSLVQGSTGDGVRVLQQDINFCYPGLSPQLVADGQFGPLTKAALVRVQSYHGIESNGQYGPQTARTMQHILKNQHYPFDWGPCSTLTDSGWPGNSG